MVKGCVFVFPSQKHQSMNMFKIYMLGWWWWPLGMDVEGLANAVKSTKDVFCFCLIVKSDREKINFETFVFEIS